MTDPTIPELVARLRELHNARRYPTETLATTIRDDQSALVYATSIGPMRAVRPVAETTVDHADLIAETLNALPAILDALHRSGDGPTSRVEKLDHGEEERVVAMDPIPVVLHCPLCSAQHIDRPDPEKGWDNPPHRSHLCAECGCIWRPADVPTVGVERATTRGANDTWPLKTRWSDVVKSVPLLGDDDL